MDESTEEEGWLVGVCSVVFDIDVGQRIEYLYPPDTLRAGEDSDVAFHSFPVSLCQ